MPAFVKFKSNVVVSKQAILVAAFINACNELGLSGERFVTSGNDSVHAKGSKHYEDRALDFRTHGLTPAQKHDLVRVLKRRLGPDYDVILEAENTPNEHVHAEHDEHSPKGV